MTNTNQLIEEKSLEARELIKERAFYKNQDGKNTLNLTETREIIRQALTQVATHTREDVEKIVRGLQDKKQSQLHGGYDDADYLNAYTDGLCDLLQSLNTKE